MHPRFRTRWTFILPALALAGALAPARAQDGKILDGKPKYVLIAQRWSWGLQGVFSNNLFKTMGYDYLVGQGLGDNANYFPLDTATFSGKNGWLHDSRVTDILNAKKKDTAVILYLPINPGFAIKGPQDTAHINLGVRLLRAATDSIKAMGIYQVFWFSTHFTMGRAKETSTAPAGADTLLVNAYNQATGSHFGVNVTTPTFREFPLSTQSDLEHPMALATAYYGTALVQAICAQDGAAPPASAIDAYLKAARDDSKKCLARVGTVALNPANPGSVKVGGSLGVTVGGGTSGNAQVRILLVAFQGGRNQEFQLDTTAALAGGALSRTVTIPDSAFINIYAPADGVKYKVKADSACIMVLNGTDRTYYYNISPFFKLLNADGTPSIPVALRPAARPCHGRYLGGASADALGRERGAADRARLPLAGFSRP